MALDPRQIHNNPEVAPRVQIAIPEGQSGDILEVLLAKILKQTMQSARRSGVIYDEGGQPRAVRRAFDDFAANSASDDLVAAVEGMSIRVLALIALCDDTATDLTLQSNATPITPLLSNGANNGEVLPFCEHGWCETAVGEGLKVTTSNDGATGLLVLYALIPNYLTDENGLVTTDENGVPLIA